MYFIIVISLDTGAINLIETIRSDYVIMTLEWTQTDPTYSYHITVVPHPPVSYSTSIEAQIRASYNTAYNVTISLSSCGQYTVTAFFKEVLIFIVS